MFLYIVLFCYQIFFYFLLDLCGAVCTHLNVTGSFMQRICGIFIKTEYIQQASQTEVIIFYILTSGGPTEKEWEPVGMWPGFGHMCFAVTVQNQHLRLHLQGAPFWTQQQGTCLKSRIQPPPRVSFKSVILNLLLAQPFP